MAKSLFRMYNEPYIWADEVLSTLTKYQIIKHKRINNILNIIIAFFCIFIFKMKLWMLPLAFLCTDVFMCFLNILTVRIIPKFYISGTTKKQASKRNKILTKKLNKINHKIKKERKYNKLNILKDEKIWLEKKIEKNNETLKNLEKAKMPVVTESVYDKINKSNIDSIKEVITKLENIKLSDDLLDHDIALTFIKAKAKSIEKLLEEKPSFVNAATTTFKIYGNELIIVLEDLMKMEPKEKELYYDKVNELISEYELHLDRLKDRIKKEQIDKTNIDISVLLKEIQKDKEV